MGCIDFELLKSIILAHDHANGFGCMWLRRCHSKLVSKSNPNSHLTTRDIPYLNGTHQLLSCYSRPSLHMSRRAGMAGCSDVTVSLFQSQTPNFTSPPTTPSRIHQLQQTRAHRNACDLFHCATSMALSHASRNYTTVRGIIISIHPLPSAATANATPDPPLSITNTIHLPPLTSTLTPTHCTIHNNTILSSHADT